MRKTAQSEEKMSFQRTIVGLLTLLAVLAIHRPSPTRAASLSNDVLTVDLDTVTVACAVQGFHAVFDPAASAVHCTASLIPGPPVVGVPITIACAPGGVVVGMALTLGMWINQVQLLCKPVTATGVLGAQYFSTAAGIPRGVAAQSSCPEGSAAGGLGGYYDDADLVVGGIQFSCYRWDARSKTITTQDRTVIFLMGTATNEPIAIGDCPDHQVLQGLQVIGAVASASALCGAIQ
jgi:hypothetical protein